MGFVEAVKTCFRKYATFNGTATRPEYWWFALFNGLVSIALGIIGGNGLRGVWSLVVLLPGLGVAVRRLHDTGRSAWWLLTAIVFPWLIVLLCLPGKDVGNPYAAAGSGSAKSLTVTEADVRPGITYCPACGKMRLPGQESCSSCGSKFPD
jgi:uncharacterized membrane protein YhaH (DUF805 family)